MQHRGSRPSCEFLVDHLGFADHNDGYYYDERGAYHYHYHDDDNDDDNNITSDALRGAGGASFGSGGPGAAGRGGIRRPRGSDRWGRRRFAV